jgi:hypothetical protein
MAATVESAFVLIDRASGPIRQIRRELRELEHDARSAGRAMDDLSGPRVAKQMEAQAREMRTLGNEGAQTSRQLDQTEKSMGRVEGRMRKVSSETKKARLEFSALGKVVSLLKWPALIAGAAGAAQVLSSLAAGAVALLPRLLDLSGAAAGLGATYVGAAAAMGTVKFATQGLSQALNGNKKALQSLTPEARSFLNTIKSMRPEIQALRQEAQRGIFPGFDSVLKALRAQRSQISGIVRQTAGDVGNLGTSVASTISAPGFMTDLRALADQGGRAFGDVARGALGFAQAIEQVLLSAQPFTDWVTMTFAHLGKVAEQEAYLARQTGQLGAFFDRTKTSMQQMGDIGLHVFNGLRGVIEAARGSGDTLWGSIDKVARRFDDWANSVTGQTRMRRFFDDMRPVLHDTAVLVGDIAKGFAHLAQGSQGSAMLQALHKAAPDIGHAIQSIADNFGPALVSAFGSVVKLMADMAGSAGPLTLVARAVGSIAHAADALFHVLGPVGPVLAQALGTFALLKKLKAFDALDALRAKWLGVGAAATDAAVAESAAAAAASGGTMAAVPGARGPMVVPGVSGAYNTSTTASGLSVAESAALAGGGGAAAASYLVGKGVLSPAEAFTATYGNAGEALAGPGFRGARFGAPQLGDVSAAGAADASGLARASGTVSRALGGLGKVALPLAAISGLLGALGTQGGIGSRSLGGLNAATFGLGGKALNTLSFGVIPSAPIAGGARRTAGGQFATNIIGNLSNNASLAAQRRTVAGLQQTIRRLPGSDSFDQNTHDLRTATVMLQAELKRRRAILLQSQREVDANLNATSIRHAQALATDFAGAFDILKRHKGPQAAMQETVKGVLQRMRHMRPAGAQVLDQTMLDWAREQAKQNPKLRGQVQRLIDGIKSDFSGLHRHVQIVNGLILTGSKTEWAQIAGALSTQTEKARQEVTKNFTAIQQEAVGSLQAMGFTGAQARQLIAGLEKGTVSQSALNTTVQAGAKNLTAAQNVQAATGATTKPHKATGGRMAGYRLPGRGTLDTVPMADGGYGAPGEVVLNRHTERDIDHDLVLAGRPPIEARVRRETRRHWEPFGPSNRTAGGRLYYTGGKMATAGQNPTTGTSSGYVYGYSQVEPQARVDQGWDFTGSGPFYAIGSGTVMRNTLWPGWPGSGGVVYTLDSGQFAGRNVFAMEHVQARVGVGQHVTPGQYIGDVLPGYPWLETGWANSSGTGPLTPYNGSPDGTPMPGGQQFKAFMLALKNGGQIPAGLPGGVAAGATAAPQQIKALKAPFSRLGGVPGALVDKAGSKYASALTQRVNQALMSAGAPAGGSATGTVAGPVVTASWFDDPQTASGHVHVPGFAELSHGGSLDFSALGHLPFGRIIDVSYNGHTISIPKVDVGAGGPALPGASIRAIDLTREAAAQLPGFISAGLGNVNWHDTGRQAFALGGRMPDWGGWHARGTDMTVNRPTVFGAGENGPERVRITPHARGGSTLQIAHGAVQVNSVGGDPRKMERYVQKRLEKFAEEVAAEIEAGAEESPVGLMS